MLAGTCLSPVPARAQDATWLAAPATAAFNTGSNWSTNTRPTGTSFFDTSTRTAITGGGSIGGMTFNPGASAYTFSSPFTFTGAGIVNNSSNVQTFTNGMFMFFENASSAGTNTAITNNGSITFSENATASGATIVNNGAGRLISFTDRATAGNATLTTTSGAMTQFTSRSTAGNAQLIANAGAIVDFSGTTGPANDRRISAGSIAGAGTYRLGANQLTVGGNDLSTAVTGTIVNGGSSGGAGASLVKVGAGTLTLGGNNTFSGGLSINGGTVTVSANNNLGAASGGVTFGSGALQTTAGFATTRTATLNATGTFNTASGTLTWNGVIGGNGGLDKTGSGTMVLGGINGYTGGTSVSAGVLQLGATDSLATGSALTVNGGTFDLNGRSQTVGALVGTGGTIALGSGTLTAGGGGNTTVASAITGSGGFVKQGAGTMILNGANGYGGGTTITGGLVNFAALGNFGTGAVTLNGGGLQWAAGTAADISLRLGPLGAGGGTFDTNGNNVTMETGIGGTGSLTKAGLGKLILAGNSTYSGGTFVTGGTLAVNGSLAGPVGLSAGMVEVNGTVGGAVTLSGSGILGGSGTIGGLAVAGGTVAPGNSIGTLNVNGNFAQNGGVYEVEVNAAGQSDRIDVSGTATINGGTVQVLAQPGTYSRNTTYTILNAVGGVSGAYSNVTGNFAFLRPSLGYDPNNVFLILAMSESAFASGARTANQAAVGRALDRANDSATGDFDTVLNALAFLNGAQGPAALDTISGQPYADFGTLNVQGAALFMNALGQQMAGARGAAGGGQRLALAPACDIAACDGAGPFSVWASALGGLGSVLGDGNASTLTYNFGGAAAGIDYRLDPRFLFGIAAGYTHGTQWVNGFMGQGWSDSISVAAYGSFTQAGFYADALAGYAYSSNRLQRQIPIPGLQQRTANGSTGADQFLGQVESGYKLAVHAPASASLTPFGRLQVSSVTQGAFVEWGASSLNLNVARQTTNSLRSTLGAELGGQIGVGNQRTVDLALRLGWQHEFADTGRPITAAFAGAPGDSFTVFGATPARDSAVIGFSAMTHVAQATQLYLRYEGGVGGGTDNHALNVGARMSW